VHISFIGQDDGSEVPRTLNGLPVETINADLTTGPDLGRARRLAANARIGFIGDVKGGPFDIGRDTAMRLLAAPNPDGRSNSAVVRPWINALDITRRPRNMWIIDFGVRMSQAEAALYEAPFEYVREHVKPFRDTVRRASYRERWWLHAEPVSGMRSAIAGLRRYLVTPETAKHHLVAWVSSETLADHGLIVFARDDDYTFGILQSKVHEVWALGQGTQFETRPRYTPTTCFETFAFPEPTREQREAISAAALDLNRLREGWLNPPGLSEQELRARTLTNLYNARPTWLAQQHERLDAAVLDAYGWPHEIDADSLRQRLVDLNLSRAGRWPVEQPSDITATPVLGA
jgi:hypothetical protein